MRSRTGELTVEVEVSDEVAPGVVSLPHGWGHAAHGHAGRTCSTLDGPSLNDVTDDGAIDPLTGNSALNGVSVTLEPAPADPSPAFAGTPADAVTRR